MRGTGKSVSGLRPANLEIAHKLLDEQDAEINRLRDELRNITTDNKRLYEADDIVTIWETPEGVKFTSVETKIIRGFRAL